MTSRRFAAFVFMVVAGLGGATACGGNDSGDKAAAPSPQQSEVSTTPPATSGSGSARKSAEAPSSMDAWEALWKDERAAIVKRIKDNHWGKSADGKTLTGPEGFTIDLSKCPAGWSDTEGVTDTELKIGFSLPQSGPAAEGAGIGYAHEALFAHYNAEKVFTDTNGKTRSVTMLLRDDAYDPARTIPLVDELIDSQHVFAIQTAGSPSTLRTYDKLNQRCIPQIMPSSGHPALGDPVNHPWTTSSSMSYATEAVMWGAFLEKRLDEFGGKAKVVSLRINNDFGAAYNSAFEAYLASSEHKDDIEYKSVTFEPTAATIKDEMTTLAAEHANMFIAMTTGASCTQLLNEAANNGMKQETPYRFLASACKAVTPVTKLGDDPDGWWTVGGGVKDATIAAYDNDPFIVAAREWAKQQGRDVTASYNLGYYYSWNIAQALQIAGQLNGGVTRSNLILALRSMDMTNPMLLGGLRVRMNGNADAYMLEGSDISRWSSKDQTWIQDSIVNLDGQTPNCAWDLSTSRCR